MILKIKIYLENNLPINMICLGGYKIKNPFKTDEYFCGMYREIRSTSEYQELKAEGIEFKCEHLAKCGETGFCFHKEDLESIITNE